MIVSVGDRLVAKVAILRAAAGESFTVLKMYSDATVLRRDKTGDCIYISVERVFEVFEPYRPRVWGEWKWAHNPQCQYRYRTDGKRVEVELWNGFRGKASCSPEDEFSEDLGISLALVRAAKKFVRTLERVLVLPDCGEQTNAE